MNQRSSSASTSCLRRASLLRRGAACPSRFVAGLVLAAPALAQGTVERVSLDSQWAQSNQGSEAAAVSADGRFVLFASGATNLVAGDTNGVRDLFLRDRLASTTERIDVATGGAQANAGVDVGAPASISADGRYVTFASSATNLVAGDVNGRMDVFLRDRATGTTTLVSRTPAGGGGNGDSEMPSISADGAFVSFTSTANNLLGPGADANGGEDVFVHAVATGAIERVSVSTQGAPGVVPGNSSIVACPAQLSLDGRYVVFATRLRGLGPELAPGGSNHADVYLRDRLLGTTSLVSVSITGSSDTNSSWPSLSDDGRYVAFESTSSSLVAGDTAHRDVFVRDVVAGVTTRASVSPAGLQANNLSSNATISSDGRFLAFSSQASNLTTTDTSGNVDLFVRDLVIGASREISVGATGLQLGNGAGGPCLARGGRYVAFVHASADVVGGDTNSTSDAFLHDRDAATPVAFCFGDGLCPCGNDGPSGTRAGCENSTNVGGALLVGGDPRLSLDTLVLAAKDLTGTTALFFQGTTRVNGGLGTVFGDGLRCAGGTIVRLGTQTVTSPGGRSAYPELGDLPVHVRGNVAAPGTRTYQVWYRNAAVFCSAETFNLTNGIEVVWGA